MSRGAGVHVVCTVGLSLIVYASWLAWPPLAFAGLGGLMCAFGVFLHRSGEATKGGK